jgi:hypothetical protein
MIMCLLGEEGSLRGGLITRMEETFVKDEGRITGRDMREGETESSDSDTELYALEEELFVADAYDLGRWVIVGLSKSGESCLESSRNRDSRVRRGFL